MQWQLNWLITPDLQAVIHNEIIVISAPKGGRGGEMTLCKSVSFQTLTLMSQLKYDLFCGLIKKLNAEGLQWEWVRGFNSIWIIFHLNKEQRQKKKKKKCQDLH